MTNPTGNIFVLNIYNSGKKIALNSSFLKKEHMDEVVDALEQELKNLNR